MISGDRPGYSLTIAHHKFLPLLIYPSVRAKVRDEVDGYSASSDYWLRCLYEGEEGDPEDVEKGFLKSRLLVRVWSHRFFDPLAPYYPTYRHLNLYLHHRPLRRKVIVTRTSTHSGTNQKWWALRNDQIMQRSSGWMDPLPLVLLHIQQYRCATRFISLFICFFVSPFLHFSVILTVAPAASLRSHGCYLLGQPIQWV